VLILCSFKSGFETFIAHLYNVIMCFIIVGSEHVPSIYNSLLTSCYVAFSLRRSHALERHRSRPRANAKGGLKI